MPARRRPAGFADPDLTPQFRLVDLNVVALTRLAGAAAHGFLARGHGAIVNIGSVVAFRARMAARVYGATKAYVLTLSQALQSELGPRGLYVQAVLPAATRTEIWERSGRAVESLRA